MKKSQVIARFLLPANKQATRTVDPGMGPFNNPTPCPKAGSDHFFPLFLLATTNVSLIASRLDQNVVPGRVISGIQTQMLPMSFLDNGSSNDDPIQGRSKQFTIMTVGPADNQSQRNPRPISQDAAFGSLLGAIGGIGSGRAAPERGFGHRAVDGLPLPLDAFDLIVVSQARLPQSFEEAFLLPFLKAIVDRRACSQLTRKSVPLDAGAQHVDHRLEGRAVGQTWASSFRMRRRWWDQRLDFAPQFITHFPGICSRHGLGLCSFRFFPSVPQRFSDKLLVIVMLPFMYFHSAHADSPTCTATGGASCKEVFAYGMNSPLYKVYYGPTYQGNVYMERTLRAFLYSGTGDHERYMLYVITVTLNPDINVRLANLVTTQSDTSVTGDNSTIQVRLWDTNVRSQNDCFFSGGTTCDQRNYSDLEQLNYWQAMGDNKH